MANAGNDKSSYARQKEAVTKYSKKHGLILRAEDLFYDKGMSGTVPVHDRPGFQNMLLHAARVGAKKVVFEDASRLARDLVVQELTVSILRDLGMTMIATKTPESFVENSICSDLIRHIIGALAQFQKSELVERLKHGRNLKLATSTTSTLGGAPKVTGKKNRLEGSSADTKVIKTVLKKFAKKRSSDPVDIGGARRALTKKGIRTAHGHEVSHAQVKTWLSALRVNMA
jgi:DNA invertase Pin-like site-specific DNA recombinase